MPTIQVLHATPHLQECLRHVYTLLSPGGRLFLQELCPGKASIHMASISRYVIG